jgi:hypothetical protein
VVPHILNSVAGSGFRLFFIELSAGAFYAKPNTSIVQESTQVTALALLVTKRAKPAWHLRCPITDTPNRTQVPPGCNKFSSVFYGV